MRLSVIAAGFFALGLAVPLALAQEADTTVDPIAAVVEEPTAETPAEAPPEETAAEEAPPDDPVDETPNPKSVEPSEAAAEEAGPATTEATGDGTADETTSDNEDEDIVGEDAIDGEDEGVEEEAAPEGTDWAGLTERAPAFLALTHHAAVHLPIALWLFGALFVVIGVVAPSWRNQVPLACLIGGTLTSVAAAASGWWYAQYEYGDEWAWGDMVDRERLAEGIVQHRWIGVALVIASVILSVIALISQAKKSKGLGFVWRVGLLLLAAAVSYEGHVGGELIMGEGFLEDAFLEWVNPEE